MKGTDTGQRDYRPVRPYWCRHIAAQSARSLLKERSEVEKIALLSSTQHISPETCPTLMLHGEQDSVVYPFHSMKFCEPLNACRVKTELDFIVNTNHAFLLAEYMRELRAPLLAESAAFPQIDVWLEKQLAI